MISFPVSLDDPYVGLGDERELIGRVIVEATMWTEMIFGMV